MTKQSDYIVLDLETTGLDPYRDKIIEVSMVKLKRGLIVEEYTSLVDPGIDIPREITALTGIRDGDVAGKPVIDDLIDEIQSFIGKAVVIAHNADFDRGFIGRYLKEGTSWLDSVTLARIAFPALKSHSLKNLLDTLNLKNESPHRALGDARATAGLFFKCREKLAGLSTDVKQLLTFLATGSEEPICSMIRDLFSDQLKAEQVVLKIPEAVLCNSGNKRERQFDDEYQLDLKEIREYFQKDGLIQQRLPYFEDRPQQLKIAKSVAKCFNEKEFLIAEAGTGTGKSLAYLLPAMLFALNSGAQVAVSTHTINLQEQLLKKDIPQLQEILLRDFDVAVLKGRSNYLCLSQLENRCRDREPQMIYFLMRIAVWLKETPDGDISGLALKSFEKWKWDLVSANIENCFAPQCQYCKNRCFIQKSKERAGRADLVIVNHSLLLADAARDGRVLPDLPYLIIDEAHRLSKVAEDQLSFRCNHYDLLKELNGLKRKDHHNRSVGLLEQIKKNMQGLITSVLDRSIFEEKIEQLEEEIKAVSETSETFFTQLYTSFRKITPSSGYYPLNLRITQKISVSPAWGNVRMLSESLANALAELSRKTLNLWDYLYNKEMDREESFNEKNRLKILSSYFREVKEHLWACFNQDSGDYVVWLEFFEDNKYPALNIAPIELGETLRTRFFADKEAVVFTSATLSTMEDSCSFFKEELGLDLVDRDVRELVLESPFYYREQAVMAIADDLPNPAEESEIVYLKAISDALITFLAASRGRAVVLFTSHNHLKSVYEQIRGPLADLGITVLAHHISGPPAELLERLREEEQCCILGASSFWEGIDVIGDALSLVIVVRLPFWPPDSPVMAARLERLEASGRNSFREYSLPQAIIRFKQGFGRLIRSGEDSGVFLVLDCRITQKAYGRSFIRALPDMEIIQESCAGIAGTIKKRLG